MVVRIDTAKPLNNGIWYSATVTGDLNLTYLPPALAFEQARPALPIDLKPLSGNNIYIFVLLGKGTVEYQPTQPFELGKTYLTFLRFEQDKSGALIRMAIPPLGDKGNFLYDPKTDALDPIVPNSDKPFVLDVLRHGRLLNDLRSALVPRGLQN